MILKQGLQNEKIKVQIPTVLPSSGETLGKLLNFLVRFIFKPLPQDMFIDFKERGRREREGDERERE